MSSSRPLPERVADHDAMGEFFSRRAIGPLAAGDPLLHDAPLNSPGNCPACHQPFKEGEFVTLVPLGPGDDPEEREKATKGRVYVAVAAVLHFACATGRDPPPRGGREPLGEAA